MNPTPTKSDQLRNYIKAHPSCTNNELASALAMSPKDVAARTSTWIKTGWLLQTEGKPHQYTWKHDRKSGGPRKPKVREEKTALPPMNGSIPTHIQGVPYPPHPSIEAIEKTRTYFQEAIKAKQIPTVAPSLFDQLVESAAELVAEHLYQFQLQVQEKLRAKLEEKLSRPLPIPLEVPSSALQKSEVDDLDLSKPEPRARLPKIGIIGLLPQQQGHISAKFHKLFDVQCLLADSNTDKMRAMARNCEVIFVHTNHVGHFVTDSLKNNGANMKLVPGGLSQMETAISDYYVEISKK